MQSLPYSFHVLATQHSIASVYPTPTQCVSAFDPIWTCPWAFAEAPPLPCTPWIRALILVYPSPLIDWLINYMVSLTVNWNSSQLWSFHHRKMFPSQPCAQGVLSIFVTCLPKDRLAANKRFLRSINLDLPILDRATLRQFLLLGFFSPPNHRMRFL
jgi:hypothetical protein